MIKNNISFMNAYHVYYLKEYEEKNYEFIDALAQIASIIFWKKNHGSVSLYCNSEYLKFTDKWDITKLYDSVNTNLLDNIPYQEYLEKYWSFPKIHAIRDISDKNTEFVVLDTDLWIHEKIEIDNSFNFIGYHPELAIVDPNNPYINPHNFVSYDDYINYDWSVRPINCAFLYFNSKDLIDEWYKMTLKVINRNKNIEKRQGSSDTIFIEQRILPTLAKKMNLNFGTLIPNVYQPHIQSDEFGNEWNPKVGFDDMNKYMTWNIKHIWGLKKSYENADIRGMIVSTLLIGLDQFFPNWENDYKKISDEINKLNQD